MNPIAHRASRALPALLLVLTAVLAAQGRAADEAVAKPKSNALRDSFGGCVRAGAAAITPGRGNCTARGTSGGVTAASAARGQAAAAATPPPLLPPPPPMLPEPPLVSTEALADDAEPLLSSPDSTLDSSARPLEWQKEPSAPEPLLTGPAMEAAATASGSAAAGPDAAGQSGMTGAEVVFEFASATLPPEAQVELDALAAAIRAFPVRGLRVIGHADRSGRALRHQRLSQQRADAVKAYLVARGIPAAIIVAEGRGAAEPRTQPRNCECLEPAQRAACLQPDRRAEVKVLR